MQYINTLTCTHVQMHIYQLMIGMAWSAHQTNHWHIKQYILWCKQWGRGIFSSKKSQTARRNQTRGNTFIWRNGGHEICMLKISLRASTWDDYFTLLGLISAVHSSLHVIHMQSGTQVNTRNSHMQYINTNTCTHARTCTFTSTSVYSLAHT